MLTVYHGATCTVENPLCNIGRSNLDFGRGFYLTPLQDQATQWATRPVNSGLPQWLNIYQLDIDRIVTTYRCLRFAAYDEAWLNFIVDSRLGRNPWQKYDYIEGGVADDRVIDTVQLYTLGLMSADVALERLAQHQPNNQMCLLSQKLIDECLHYVGCEPLHINTPTDTETATQTMKTIKEGGTPC